MSLLSAFNCQLINLLNNLCDMYPKDPDLSFTKTSVTLMKKTNPRKLQEMFDDYVAKHEQKIMTKDEDFILTKDFISEDFAEMDSKDWAYMMMQNLRKYWTSIDDESKQNIWKYLQVLVVLNKKASLKKIY